MVQGNSGARAGRRDNILCWNNSNLVFIMSLFTGASACTKSCQQRLGPMEEESLPLPCARLALSEE